jgi:ferredoxin-NADP reductase/ferredoxin
LAQVAFRGSTYEVGGQSLLDCLTTHGHDIPAGCRAGVCQSCLMRVVRGAVPAKAQEGLPPNFVARGLFLACQCHPAEDAANGDLEVASADAAIEHYRTSVRAVERLNMDTCALRLHAPAHFRYRAGQFLQLYRDDRTMRNYSLASVPDLDQDLEIHVRRVRGGQVSGWIFEQLHPGCTVTISEPRGNCFYAPGAADQSLLLIGTGSGLAPLYGIARDALHQGHHAPIHLYHGSQGPEGLYLDRDLHRLAAAHANFFYGPCVAQGPPIDGLWNGSPLDRALGEHQDLSGWRVYLCGNPQLVEAARMQTFLAGAASSQILADPFLPTGNGRAPAQTSL